MYTKYADPKDGSETTEEDVQESAGSKESGNEPGEDAGEGDE